MSYFPKIDDMVVTPDENFIGSKQKVIEVEETIVARYKISTQKFPCYFGTVFKNQGFRGVLLISRKMKSP